MSPEEVLVLGATGLVGSHVVRELRSRGYAVLAVSRRPVAENELGVRWIQANATVDEDIARLPVCERVVSTLAIWLTAGVAPTLVSRGARRLVAFSSSSALTKTDASDEGERELSRTLLEGERAVFSLAPVLQATILRPTMIYGGPGDANVERIAAQLRRFHVFPLVGNGSGLRQPVHAGDLGRAAVQALQSAITEGKTYTLAGAESLSVRHMVQRVGETNGARARFLRVPLKPAQLALQGMARVPRFRNVPPGALERLARDLTFDNTDAIRDFDYAPRAFDPPDYRAAR